VIHHRHALTSIIALALTSALVVGCSPAPEPTPTPTAAFASEEEAFAVAEGVFHKYNDAGNAGDDTSVFLTGAALERDIEFDRYLKEQDLMLSGTSIVESFAGTGLTNDGVVATVTADVCLDISQTRLLDSVGIDVTPTQRPPKWLLVVKFTGSKSEMLITDSAPASGRSC
jgi:hypothetical protein